MKIPVIQGTIKRRMLINFRVDPDVMRRSLPRPFRPKLHNGCAIAGVCLIRLEDLRPAWLPPFLGFASENAAHRIAVEWEGSSGLQEGVFIPRRDTGSRLNHLADFRVSDDGTRVDLAMESHDKATSIRVCGATSESLPASSCFASLAESSKFFECGALGYSVTRQGACFDGLLLKTLEWRLRAFSVDVIDSHFFSDTALFPPGSAQFDHVLIMRDIAHEWHFTEPMSATPESALAAE